MPRLSPRGGPRDDVGYEPYVMGLIRTRTAAGSALARDTRRGRGVRIVLALVVLAGASYIFIAGDSGLMELAQRREELRRLEQHVADLVAENDSLKRVLSLLDSDSSFVEKVAREKYEMVKPGESLYLIRR